MNPELARDPRWEWVQGDAAKAARYGFASGLLFGGLTLGLVILTLNALGLNGVILFPTLSPWAAQLILWLILGPEFAYLYFFNPRRYPVIQRLGISPFGLRVGLLLRGRTVPWNEVVSVGPGWIELRLALGIQRYRLTDPQMERLSRFLAPR